MIRIDRGDLAGAIRDADEAIRLDPKYLDAYRLRNWARVLEAAPDLAMADLAEFLKIAPDDLDALYGHAWGISTLRTRPTATASGRSPRPPAPASWKGGRKRRAWTSSPPPAPRSATSTRRSATRESLALLPAEVEDMQERSRLSLYRTKTPYRSGEALMADRRRP